VRQLDLWAGKALGAALFVYIVFSLGTVIALMPLWVYTYLSFIAQVVTFFVACRLMFSPTPITRVVAEAIPNPRWFKK
jgi:uncharacterized membrane protein